MKNVGFYTHPRNWFLSNPHSLLNRARMAQRQLLCFCISAFWIHPPQRQQLYFCICNTTPTTPKQYNISIETRISLWAHIYIIYWFVCCFGPSGKFWPLFLLGGGPLMSKSSFAQKKFHHRDKKSGWNRPNQIYILAGVFGGACVLLILSVIALAICVMKWVPWKLYFEDTIREQLFTYDEVIAW